DSVSSAFWRAASSVETATSPRALSSLNMSVTSVLSKLCAVSVRHRRSQFYGVAEVVVPADRDWSRPLVGWPLCGDRDGAAGTTASASGAGLRARRRGEVGR